MPDVSITGEGVGKSYGTTTALKGLDFSVNKGEIFGFIGPDGAGKTTLFRILTTLLLPGSGRVCVEGYDVVKDYRILRRILGYMPGKFSLYHDLSVEENLRFFAGIFGVDVHENYHLVKDIYSQIEPFAKRRAGKLSGGMKQKLALSCALIHKPVVLVLDEPTTGVDAVSRREFWEMLLRLKSGGITIVVSTPYMDEAMRCDRVALMQQGSIMTTGTPQEIIAAFPRKIYRIKGSGILDILRLTRNMKYIRSAELFGDAVHISTENTDQAPTAGEISQYLSAQGLSGHTIKEVVAGIEDCFIDRMKQQPDKHE